MLRVTKQVKTAMGVGFLNCALNVGAVFAQDCDIAIMNGRVMDPETNFDGARNVCIKGDRIAKITKDKITGKDTLEAKGLVVAPGFIDLHFHNVSTPFGQRLGLRDGVTTQLEIEAGVFPVDMWYSHMKGKSQANYGATVATMSIRETVLNPKFKTKWGATILHKSRVPQRT